MSTRLGSERKKQIQREGEGKEKESAKDENRRGNKRKKGWEV